MILALREGEARSLIDQVLPSALEALNAPLQWEIEPREKALDPIESGKLDASKNLANSLPF